MLLYSLSPEIIHCHNNSMEKILLPCLLKKSILTVHGFNMSITSINKYRQIVAISKAIQTDLIQKGIKNLSVVYNGVKTELIEQKKLFNSQIKIVCVGRMEHQTKGQDVLIKAFALLRKKTENVQLHLIGHGVSEKYLHNLVNNFELTEDVIFHGSKTREELYKLLKLFDLMVQPSIHEGFGLTVVEGMCAKLPIIISNASGLLEVTNDGEFAQYIINPHYPKNLFLALENTINKINSKDKNFIKKIESARIFALDQYSLHKTCINYKNVYINNIIQDSKKSYVSPKPNQ